MLRVAVTGASGFVGHHIIQSLANAPVSIVAHARTVRPEHINSEKLSWVYFDLADDSLDAFERLQRPDILLHLAWEGLPNYNAQRHFVVELPRQFQFLSQVVDSGLKRLVVTGTCLEYGLSPGERHETDSTEPTTFYGLAKDTLRRSLVLRYSESNLDFRWLRLFYQYGPGQAATSLYSQLHAAIARGDREFDMSYGEQIRDFMPAEDVSEAIIKVALATSSPSIINICSGIPRSVRGLVEQWRELAHSRISLNLGRYPYPNYEPFAFWGNRSRLNDLLESQPNSLSRLD